MPRRLRRRKDGQIFGYSTALAKAYGMEIVECDDDGNVIEVIGEIGYDSVFGRRTQGDKVVPDPVLNVSSDPPPPPPSDKDDLEALLYADNSDLS